MEPTASTSKLDLVIGIVILITIFTVFVLLLSPFLVHSIKGYTHGKKVASCENQEWVRHEPQDRAPNIAKFCEWYTSAHESKARFSDMRFLNGFRKAPLWAIKNKAERVTLGAGILFLKFFDEMPSWYVESVDGIGLAMGLIRENEVFADLHDDYKASCFANRDGERGQVRSECLDLPSAVTDRMAGSQTIIKDQSSK